MQLYRKTAIVQFELFSGATEGSLPLACERDFGVILTIEGVTYPAENFRSPINDEQWRLFYAGLRDCNMQRDQTGYRNAASIRSLAYQLYESLVDLSPALREFLGRAGDPRRLVIQTRRPELHLLPWAAMIDDTRTFLAAGDLSVVHSWADFNLAAITTGNELKVKTVMGADTNRMTAASVAGLPSEIQVQDGTQDFEAGKPVQGIDILHLEKHGDAVTNMIGDVFAATLAHTFAGVSMALLWSCCSGAANSWGESPALCLHKQGAGFVLSFLAELHNLDAKSISAAFYREVFGPAASRDPETALVRIRAYKFANEFPYANWASMTVYMRAPLDLNALPLNGPRVPQAQWSMDQPEAPPSCCAGAEVASVPAGSAGPATGDAAQVQASATAAAGPDLAGLWKKLASTVSQLQPGLNEFHDFEELPNEVTAKLPAWVFAAWRGNVIRLDGAEEPLAPETLRELGVVADGKPKTDAAERLVWFFRKIVRYGSPLIVWTNAAPRHLAFLRTIEPSSTLTFLLMYGKQPPPTLIDLVNENRLAEAQAECAKLRDPCSDDVLSAAYFAFARNEATTEQAVSYIRRLSSKAEKWMLIANFISRRSIMPDPRADWMLNHPNGRLTTLQQQHCQEDYFQLVISNPGDEAPLRESGRAKHELGYLLQSLRKTSAAETLYERALADLEKCPENQHDYRWHDALARLLRDWAHLLATMPERLGQAQDLLYRAMAIHSFHGRRLQIAYCLETAALIALTGHEYSKAIENAVDSANLFEKLNNWRGWAEAMKVLFDCLAETRETTRMHSLADLAIDKLETSKLPPDEHDRLRHAFIFEKANANWIAGKLAEARSELEKLGLGSADPSKLEFDPQFEPELKRLWRFLALGPQA
jgi:hypothetical protein